MMENLYGGLGKRALEGRVAQVALLAGGVALGGADDGGVLLPLAGADTGGASGGSVKVVGRADDGGVPLGADEGGVPLPLGAEDGGVPLGGGAAEGVPLGGVEGPDEPLGGAEVGVPLGAVEGGVPLGAGLLETGLVGTVIVVVGALVTEGIEVMPGSAGSEVTD
ncbi:hypothetical protein MMC10_003579 [Thelotrema lepadinum]|nr:hypothetical protein [Thelotrema lepadinum]